MLGGAELWIIAVVVAAVVVIVLIAARRIPVSAGGDGADSKVITLSERGDDWLVRVATSVSGLPGHRVEWSVPGSLDVIWTRRPVWTFAVAIVFFPLGLLALLVTRTVVGRLRIVEAGPPARIEASGQFAERCIDVVNRAIPD